MSYEAIMRWLAGRMNPCLMLLLASCATPVTSVRTITVHDPVVVAVPSVYTQPISVPRLSGDNPTNGDLAHYALMLRHALDQANARLRAIAGLAATK